MPLKTGEDEEYMLALKQELRETVRRMPYFIEAPEEKPGTYRAPVRLFAANRQHLIKN